MRNSDSGVVMRMSGGWVTSRRRSAAGVSPVRTPTLISERRRTEAFRRPRRPDQWGGQVPLDVDPECLERGEVQDLAAPRPRGARALRAGAVRPVSRSAGSGSVARRSIAVRKAARVFPEPVGATTRVSSPRSIASHAAACAGVGASNDSANHVEMAAEKDDGSRWRDAAIAPLWPDSCDTGPSSAPDRRAEGQPPPCQLPGASWQDGGTAGPAQLARASTTTKG